MLARLVAAGHDVVLVLTQPDRPSGRGMRSAQSAVKRFAEERKLPLSQPQTLRSHESLERVRDAHPTVIVVVAYGLLLPQEVLRAAPLGAINIHASLLPRWRGAAPIQRSLLAGDQETGVSIMQMDAGLDTGPVLAQRRTPIAITDDAGSLHDRLAALGAGAILDVLAELERGRLQPVQQSHEGATYAPKLDKRESLLDWTRSAVELERATRAFRPTPGAFTLLDDEPLKVWRARVVPGQGAPGTLLPSDGTLTVACGDGALEIEELQRTGGRRMATAEFLRGHVLPAGKRLG